METMLVRLKPYNKKKGHILRRYIYRGIRFQEGKGWNRVRNDVATYLKNVHAVPHDEDSPLAFDVCTEEEAKAIDQKETLEAKPSTPAEEAKDIAEARVEVKPEVKSNDLSTADLPSSQGFNRPRRRIGGDV